MSDIKLTISGQNGGNAMPLDLARDSNGRKDWRVTELYSGGSQTDKLFEQTDWSGGWGQTSLKDATRYTTGENIDTTNEGYFTLGPNPTSGSNVVYHLVDGACAKDNAVYTDETAGAIEATNNDMTLLPAAPVVDQDAYYFGSDETFNKIDLYLSTAGVGTWTITWKYWDGAAWSALSGVSDGTSGFTTGTAGHKVVSFTLPGDWATTNEGGNLPDTIYWVKADLTSYTAITTQPLGGQAWVSRSDDNYAFDTTVTKYIYWPYLVTAVAAAGKKLYVLSSDTWLQRIEFSADITDICVYNAKLYIALGSSTTYQYTSDGATFTATDLADDDFTYFMVAPSADGTEPVLWGADSNYIKSTTDPDAGGTEWSDAYYISESGTDITGLMLHQNNIYVGKSDGLYRIYSSLGSMEYLLPELQHATSSNNFKYHVNYKNSLYFSLNTRIGELSAYGYYKLVDPYQDIEEYIGEAYCVGLTCDRDYLYAAMYDGTDYIIFRGFYTEDSNGRRIWHWCPWIDAGTSSVDYIEVSPWSTSYIFLHFNSSGTTKYVVISDNPLSDSDYDFNTSDGYLVTSWFDAGKRDWTKILESVICECRGYDNDTGAVDLSANVYVKIYYEIDESGSWTAIDSVYSDDNPKSGSWVKKYLDASTLASGQRIRFKIELVTNDASITPVVKYFCAYGQVRPPNRKVYEFSIPINPGTKLSKTIWDFLDAGRDSTALITLNDRFGSDVYVEFVPGYPQQIEVRDEVSKQVSLVAVVKALEIDWS